MELVELKDALQWIGQGKPFQCRFITYDRRSRKGGKAIDIKQATKTSRYIQKGILRVKLSNGQIREFHHRLMTHFNGKRIIW